MIKIENLTISFSGKKAVSDLSLDLIPNCDHDARDN